MSPHHPPQAAIITTATAATAIPQPCRPVNFSRSTHAASTIVDAGYSEASTAATSSRPARVAAINIMFPVVSSAAVNTAHRATAHLIPVANEGNGYKSAGTGYMRMEGEATPIRVRFPYTDDDQLAAWSTEFSELRAARKRERSSSALPMDDVDPTECRLRSDASADKVPYSLWNG